MSIGVVLPLTGPWSDWGASLRKSIEFIAQYVGATEQLVFHFEDEGGCDARKAVDAYRALRARYKVQLLIIGCMNGARAIKPIAEREGALLLSIGFQEREIFEKDGAVINYALQMDDEAELIASKALELGVQRLGMVRDAGTDAFVATMRRSYTRDRVTSVVFDAVLDSSSPEWRAVATALKDKGVEALFVNTSPQNIQGLLRALSEQHLSIPLLSSYGFRDIMREHAALRRYPVTAYYTYPEVSAAAADFERIFWKKFGESPRVNALFVVDLMMEMKSVESQCRGTRSLTCVRRGLAAGREIDGVSGRFRVNPDGSVARNFKVVSVVDSCDET
jgi:ABC-type branched-subunit amino acid transport system substrate-binding protein